MSFFLFVSFALGLSAAPLPDFTGEWRLINSRSQFANQPAPKSKVMRIDHREPKLVFTIDEAAAGNISGTVFYSTDGVERTNEVLGAPFKTTSKWEGSTLVMRGSGKMGDVEIALVDRMELSPDGTTLTMKRHFEGRTSAGAMPPQDQVLVHEAVPLRAGVARIEITPAEFMPMYGYANRRCGPANGVHDPLFAKVVVLQSALTRVAIVTADLGSYVSDALRQDVAEKLGIPSLLLAASHTHSAPFFLPQSLTPTSALGSEPPTAAAYRAELDRKVFDAVKRASESMFPAKLRAGRGSVTLGYNRLTMRENGRARALFDNLDRLPLGPADPVFTLLEVQDEAGTPRALLVHYATHAVVLGPTNCKYSADFPGAMQTAVEAALPGTQVMFVQGGAGDINPIFQGRTGDEKADFALVDKLGKLLAAEVVKSRSGMTVITPSSQPLRVKTSTLKLEDRWDTKRSHEIGISTILIGRDVAIAATPGEPMQLFQTEWRAKSEVPFALYYGYTFSAGGEWPGYLPDLRTAAYGGYGGDSTATRVEAGAGERILQRHLINLYDLRGFWQKSPGQP
ncbi:MAG: neutral/alkaline non-lysosomal ceramidase N-terminal domain-containing protein [Candidatus Solibacter usitatus]|nr:neutral/alkaline non-lysosomal ceramidase N-terminal domain-containing protein [Candidatus Solibacter usitatus]